MIIVKINHQAFLTMRLPTDMKSHVVLLECQSYGKVNRQFWHFAVSDSRLAQFLIQSGGGEIIADTGRAEGYWQSLGASGVLNKQLLPSISGAKPEFLTRVSEAKISIGGSTWAEIINNMPDGFCENLKTNKLRKVSDTQIEYQDVG